MALYDESFLSHPLTPLFFDRNPEQRAEHEDLVTRARVGYQLPDDDAVIYANRVMIDGFLDEVASAKEAAVRTLAAAAINQGPSVDIRTIRLQAGLQVDAEIGVLHTALPFRTLDAERARGQTA